MPNEPFADDEDHGKYIVQVTMGRHVHGSIFDRYSSISFMRRGGKHPGVLDEQLFICTHCGGLMTQADAENNVLCNQCGASIQNPGDLSDFQMHKGDMSALAKLVYKQFEGLNGNADLKLIRHRADTTYQDASRMDLTPREREKNLNVLRSSIEVAFYTKGRLEKDMRGGADPLKLIEGFLNA